jgi:hypothetical protein
METTKEQVIRLFLAFLSRHVPIGQAQLATLGGHGLEAKIWFELGVPSGHGWLIERSRERGGKLIRGHRYQMHNQLGTFDRILAGHGADRTFIDGFHLDLCGTLCNTAIENFSPVVPLVLASTGRCLAITVADARRNLVLEQWPDFQKRARRLFGSQQSEGIYRRIVAYQQRVPVRKDQPAFIKPFDPTKAAQREFGLLVELTELLRKQKLSWIPVAVERYIYVSRYQRRPFRMRTYFFHFGERMAQSSELAFAEAWITSKLSFANGDGFHEVEAPPVGTTIQQKIKKGVEKTVMTETKLIDLSGYVAVPRSEYEQLVADSQQLSAFRALLQGAKNSIPAQDDSTPNHHPSPTSDVPQSRKRRTKKQWDDLTDQEQIEWQLKALELKAEMGGAWKNGSWEKLLKQDFGHHDAGISGSCRAALARTNGNFRQMFEARIQKVFGDQAKSYLDRFAKLQK